MTPSTRTTAHVLPHTHWDREWYLPYEQHHVRLVRLMDDLIEIMEQDPEYKSFFLDGQTIILDDYLQVRPDNRERLAALIRAGRIEIGPWYILQDAYLTSAEANVRNLQIGHRDAAVFGKPAKIGYYPDTFGIYGQAPQLMRQAGIESAAFGRGVKPTGFNNTVSEGYESSHSELVWEGPDGSRVLGILFANWYCNGMEVPVDAEDALHYWGRKLKEASRYASTNQLLFMNGCDHQPVQLDLSAALRTARELFPDTDFVHARFSDYIEQILLEPSSGRSVVKGELRSQHTDGWSTLVNTASARIYLKQMNQRGQALLEKVAEPMAAYASLYGQAYPKHLLTYAWKTLMQNHPHDSICGCSVDEVHREMVTRFDKSRHVAEALIVESRSFLSGQVDTSAYRSFGEDALPVVVFNTTGWDRTGAMTVDLDVARIYQREEVPPAEAMQRLRELDLVGRVLVDENGDQQYVEVEDLGLQFGYDLPEDRFRQPYWCRRVRLSFEAQNVPANGLRTYAWVNSHTEHEADIQDTKLSLVTGPGSLENAFLRVEVNTDGTFSITEKGSGRVYPGLGVYEDCGDIGNEYMFKQPDGVAPITTAGSTAEVEVVEDTKVRATLLVTHTLSIPESADDLFVQEKQEAVYYAERKSGRSVRTVPLVIQTRLTLERSSAGLGIRTSFDNQALDHRVRLLFPTGFHTDSHRADSIFETVERPNRPAEAWLNPSNCQHQQAFVDMDERGTGLVVSNLGLNEYEVLEENNTIAITLLRSVGELGDWGVFPTPDAQCLGQHTAELLLIPYSEEEHGGFIQQEGAYRAAYQFQVPWTHSQTGIHSGVIGSRHQPFAWKGEGLVLSSWKENEDTGDHLVRWYNRSMVHTMLTVLPMEQAIRLYKSDVLERVVSEWLPAEDGRYEIELAPAEILTLGVQTI